MLKSWLTFLRVPELFTLPGEVFAGFLLTAAELPRLAVLPLIALSLSAVLASVCGSIFRAILNIRDDILRHPERPLPSGAVSPRAAMVAMVASGLLSLAFAIIAGPLGFLAVLLLLCASFSLKSLPVAHGLRVTLGVIAAIDLTAPEINRTVIAGIFALGLILYSFGRWKVLSCKPELTMKPGRRFFFAGAVIAYGTLFGIAVNMPTDHWYTITCGIISALSSGLFIVLMYWSFRLLQYPNTPDEVRRNGGLLLFSLIFLHAAAAALFGSLILTGIFIAGAILSRLIAIYLSKPTQGV
ncbi:MAG: UbiA family prenyltransferase [Lentisphaeria bacterium]|nr:UbiA family prenyltransferase [Lentisphaeria bacterium]